MNFIPHILLLFGLLLHGRRFVMSDTCLTTPATETYPNLRFPAEWEPHNLTLMSFPGSYDIWGNLLSKVQEDVAKIAKAVAEFESVVMMVRPSQVKRAKRLLGSTANVSILPLQTDDLWARDTAPVFLMADESKVVGVTFNFNGWGNKQKHDNDSQIAVKVMDHYDMECIKSPLISEGGSFETDGQGTLMVTESSIINDNRNPGKSKATIEKELKETLGVQKVIWFPGVYGHDITDAHADCLARFTSPGVVILNTPAPGTDSDDVWAVSSREAKEILETATDAKGNKFRIVELQEPDPEKISYQGTSEDFLTSYVNYLVVNGGVVMPKFGDEEADEKARQTLQDLYPSRKIVQVEINTLASGGGGIHCATHDMPM